jgi:TonB-linked SusC/RagA family outer membrane protein
MKYLLPLFLFFYASTGYTQSLLTGIVQDAQTDEALVGVSVFVKGKNIGTATNAAGKFSLPVTKGDILLFNYTGYAPQEIAVSESDPLFIKLREDINSLEQIVVIGYGTQKKTDLTGAVGSIKAKDIERIPSAQVDQALQGKMAGVYVSPVSGEPGKGAIIRIRGTGTLNNANPLYVVDGMLLDDISFLNPSDVASVEVLKDASATAIYGNRGANGVLLITTKKGSAGKKAVLQVDAYYGQQDIARTLSLANAAEFATLYNELTKSSYYPNPEALGAGTDWQAVIFRTAPMASAQAGLSGQWKKITYAISGNYFNQQGIQEKTGFVRNTGRANLEFPLGERVKAGTNVAFSGESNKTVLGGVLGSAYRMPPVFAEKDSTGAFSDPTFFGLAIANPAADLYYKNDWRGKVDRIVGTTYLDVSLLPGLTLRSNFGWDRRHQRITYREPVFRVSASQLNNLNRHAVSTEDKYTWLWENTLHYDKQAGPLHLNLMGGYTMQEYTDDFTNLVNDTLQPNGKGGSEWAMVSYLARVNITHSNRYLFTASLRADGSSRFAQQNRWGFFPSAAMGWNLTREPWMENQKVFDRLKLRASWGIVGNDKTQTYPSLGFIENELYAVFGPDQQVFPAATLVRYANPSVRWESASQTDVGLEWALLEGKLSGEVDWYNRFTYDILAELPIPDYVGSQSAPVVNSAEVRNKGWDVAINWRTRSGAWSYNLGVVFSTVNNTVVKLNQGKSEIFAAGLPTGDFATRTVVGQPIGAFYGYRVAGVFQNQEEINTLPKIGTEKPGDLRFSDINADGVITEKDRTYLGSPIPTETFGWSGGLEWGGLEFTADFFGVRGNKVLNAKSTARYGVYNWEKLYFENRWTSENSTTATAPRTTNGGHNYRMSEFLIKDGSFIRLRSVVLGYALPPTYLKKMGIERMRIYVSGTNLWTRQQYDGYSTEFPNGGIFDAGIDYLNYPMSKTYLAGMNLTF